VSQHDAIWFTLPPRAAALPEAPPAPVRATLTVSVDAPVEVSEGALLDAAARRKTCRHSLPRDLTPVTSAVCRGSRRARLAPACSRKAEAGMKVHTICARAPAQVVLNCGLVRDLRPRTS
jgi:hypothetical protein